MSSNPFQVTRSAYVVVLKKTDPSPLAPESDEEKIAEEKSLKHRVHRVISLPKPSRRLIRLRPQPRPSPVLKRRQRSP